MEANVTPIGADPAGQTTRAERGGSG
jgi:hypothetical protein